MSTLGHDLAGLYARELDRLADEIAAYGSDTDLWSTIGGQKNAPGTLALHTIGGLNAFIGGSLGGTGYVRDRDFEFSERDVPRDEIVRRIRECKTTVVPIIEGIGDEAMSQPHPGPLPEVFKGATTHWFLAHLLWHIGWHQGHIYYHRMGLA